MSSSQFLKSSFLFFNLKATKKIFEAQKIRHCKQEEAVKSQFAGKGRRSLTGLSAVNGRSKYPSGHSRSLMGAQHPPLHRWAAPLNPSWR
ncbi:hypothetical protein CEXT_158611 [Caerostris extrusa]|uniref:Uncharacterized protein n=1 Tax=Caerostris extrusa TaxID=172846 RepID=A0AAV4UKI1_CAEEX|nr:hypothetical protein CEXT_158611 [Caerostris extrusa]